MPADTTLLTTNQVMRRYSRTRTSIWFWQKDSRLGFPQPIYIRSKKYWRLQDLLNWERRLRRERPQLSTAGCGMTRIRSPQGGGAPPRPDMEQRIAHLAAPRKPFEELFLSSTDIMCRDGLSWSGSRQLKERPEFDFPKPLRFGRKFIRWALHDLEKWESRVQVKSAVGAYGPAKKSRQMLARRAASARRKQQHIAEVAALSAHPLFFGRGDESGERPEYLFRALNTLSQMRRGLVTTDKRHFDLFAFRDFCASE